MTIALLIAILVCVIAYFAICVACERDQLDAHTRQHAERPEQLCPWCEAARPTLADQLADLNRRRAAARERDQERFDRYGLPRGGQA